MQAHSRIGAALVLVLGLGTVAAFPTSAAGADPPVPLPFDSDFADPYVLREGDTYFAFATGALGKNVQVARSRDLVGWTTLADALPNLPAWAAQTTGMIWAPSVLRREGSYVLYYTAPDAESGFQCISRASSLRPEGPYVDDSSRPFICQTAGDTAFCGSIDPSPYVDEGGRTWLLWKSDENHPACRTASRIWSQQLAGDGLSLVGEPSALLTTDRSWEGPLVEGPSMIREGNATLLFYSAHSYESADYAVGYARCDGPIGPCKKMTLDAPLLKSFGNALGPGGQELFTDALGRTWMAYHAWTAPKVTYAASGARSLRFARVSLAKGVPVLVTTSGPRRSH